MNQNAMNGNIVIVVDSSAYKLWKHVSLPPPFCWPCTFTDARDQDICILLPSAPYSVQRRFNGRNCNRIKLNKRQKKHWNRTRKMATSKDCDRQTESDAVIIYILQHIGWLSRPKNKYQWWCPRQSKFPPCHDKQKSMFIHRHTQRDRDR